MLHFLCRYSYLFTVPRRGLPSSVPIFSVLLTYSLKINSVLYLTILIGLGLTETSCWSTDSKRPHRCYHLYQTRLRISTAGLIFSILYNGLGMPPPQKKNCPLPIPGPLGSTRVHTQNSSLMAFLHRSRFYVTNRRPF